MARVGIMGDGDDVGIRVVTNGVDASNLASADVVNAQQTGVGGVLCPSLFAVDVFKDALSQCDSSS